MTNAMPFSMPLSFGCFIKEHIKSRKYDSLELLAKIMGPNPFKLQEEMPSGHKIPAGEQVCDLESRQGLTSVMLVKNYGNKVVNLLELFIASFLRYADSLWPQRCKFICEKVFKWKYVKCLARFNCK
ncbi:MAG: hypothetical protein PHO18_06505 [Synergistaceae bacterium]|nr:hypothetical protein [Synergistaceae bacterium]